MYKRKKNYPSPDLCSPPLRHDMVRTVHEDGTEEFIAVTKHFKHEEVLKEEANRVHDLQRQLKAGIVPEQVNCLLTPTTGETLAEYSERAHQALGDLIVNAERRIAETIVEQTPSPSTEQVNE